MKKSLLCPLVVLGFLSALWAAPQDLVGADDTAQAEYKGGWHTGQNSGDGFGPWNLQSKSETGGDSYAGFYLGTTEEKPELNPIAAANKAFALFANGTGYETATAFRPFTRPLRAGQSFSFLMKHGTFVKKFATDSSAGGSFGVTLLNDAAGASPDDYNKGSRFEFGYYQTENAYLIYDGDGMKKLDVPFTDGGLALTLTLVTPDTYNLEITALATKQIYHVKGRKLTGTPGSPVGGFCLFDRNGETNDVYFNGFQVLQKP